MPSLSPRRPLVLLALIVVMAAIFLIDTVTGYLRSTWIDGSHPVIAISHVVRFSLYGVTTAVRGQ